ncbi:MAG: DUF5320 domain-containing protein [Saccharofermentanales bacterium]
MPGGDRTGPMGMGPMTGRGLGFCGRGYGLAYGRGFGPGNGRGFSRRGYRFGGYPVGQTYLDGFNDKAVMEDQVKFLEDELEMARKQLDEIRQREGK